MITKKPKYRFAQKVWFNQFGKEYLYPSVILGILGLHEAELIYEVAKHSEGISTRRWAFESQLTDASFDPNFSFNTIGVKDHDGRWRFTRAEDFSPIREAIESASRSGTGDLWDAIEKLE